MNYDFADRDLLLGVLGEVRDAVLITDARLHPPGPTIVYANPAFCDMTGYAPENIEGRTPRLLQGPDTDRNLMQQLKSQLVAGQPFFGETVNYRKDGTPFRMQWTIRQYPAHGTAKYYIAIQRDITVLRDVEQQRQQLQVLADIHTIAGTAGLDLPGLRNQVAQIGLAVTGADGAAVEEAVAGEMVYTAAAGTAVSSLGLRLPVAGSLSGACYRDRQPMYCRDTHNDPRVVREAADRIGFRSGLLVPLIHEDRCFGVLKVYSGQVSAFSDSDLDMLTMASRVLASSLYDAQSVEQERGQHTQLIDALPILIARIDAQLFFREINAGYTAWFQRPAGQIIGKPAVDIIGQEMFERALPYMKAALAGEEVIFEHHLQQVDGSMMPVEITYIPQRDNDQQVVGFYALARDITDRRRAERDYLTQTLNRRGFDARLDVAFATAKRYHRPLSLIFVDLDHFKTINDNHGHALGDEVLRTAAQVLCEQVRDSDIVCRWGGEEFVILAPETPLAEAVRLSERLRQTLASCQHPEVGQVTASFGVAELASEQSERDFISHADQALYAAKGAGRNRVECYSG